MVDSSTQTTNVDAADEVDPCTDFEPLIYGMDSDYHDAYRDGNFGLKRGRINITRAKRWSQAHLVVAILMTVFSISAVGLMEAHFGIFVHDTADAFSGISISCGIVAIITSCCSIYLVYYLATMRRPLFVLLLVRLLSVLECMLVISGFVTIFVYLIFNALSNPKSDYYGLFIFLCVSLMMAMIVDFIIAGAWLFHWWRWGNPELKSVCIFELGEPLAEGVPDPRTNVLRECMYVFWSAYRAAGCGTII